MGADEHQRQAAVGQRPGVFRRLQFFGREAQRCACLVGDAAAPRCVDSSPSRRHDQPAFGIVGHAAARPFGQRRGERVGQGVLRGGDVAAARSQKGDELAVTLACDPRRRRAGGVLGFGRHIGQIGRTSIAPSEAPGQRATQPIAASRSAASMT